MSYSRAELVGAAGVDPWALQRKVDAGDPAQIEHLAAAFYRAGGDAEHARTADTRAGVLVRHGYSGGTALDYNAQARATSRTIAHASESLPKIAKVLTGVADDLTAARGGADREIHALEADLRRVEASWQSFAAGAGTHLAPEDKASAQRGYLNEAIAAVRIRGAAVGRHIDTYERSLARALRSMADLGFVPPTALRDADTATVPGTTTPPAKVAAWWKSLTPAEQHALLASRYASLGQLHGLPATVLDTANRHRLKDRIAEDERAIAYARTHSPDDPYGHEVVALMAAKGQDQNLLKVLTGSGQPPPLLLRYDPDGAQGQEGAEIAYGNPDTAKDTAVVVPGTGNNVGKIAGIANQGKDLYDQMSSSSKSVVVWIDGPEPQSLTDAAGDSYAESSAPRLRDDLAGLRAAHAAAGAGPGHITAIGHSYGSYILGKALTSGADVDDAIFVGSPGVGVNHAGDLGMSGKHVWSGQAGDDPILLSPNRFTPGAAGYNPSESEFGAQHFDVHGSSGHSEYYQGESLTNMARIADGNYGSVDKVDAPDYRGLRELPTDAVDAVILDPLHTGTDTLDKLVHGHPIDAGEALVDGTLNQAKDFLHTSEDALEGAGDLIGDAWDSVFG